ncbi:60S ribosomal protein L18a-like protein [Quillaja saponaria]|uniref:60S ribosomal protein L18a-like protein n=1 Tax=Quillaja saponaria TaxID=32244 RepID=A0AAD7PVL2_QUISA|nr:60S ribosomal protein L18a-like protein [Quillaja saponaria]
MSEDGKNKGVTSDQNNQYYGTFQGVANYTPPVPQSPPQPVVGFPQPVPPAGFGGPGYYHHGYQTVQGYAVVEGRPVREHRLPCCGLGLGWFLDDSLFEELVLGLVMNGSKKICNICPRFIVGFFLGGIPWYIGTFIILCVRLDYREKPGLVACTVASILAVLAITLGATKRAHAW